MVRLPLSPPPSPVDKNKTKQQYQIPFAKFVATDLIPLTSTHTPIPTPSSCLDPGTDIPSLRTSSRYASYSDNELASLARDLQHESRILSLCLEKGRLGERYQGVVEQARKSVMDDREEKLNMLKEREVKKKEKKGMANGDGKRGEVESEVV